MKFPSTHRAEILLRLPANFSPGAMLKIGQKIFFSGKEFYIHNSSGAHAQVHISPGLKFECDYMRFLS